MNRIAPLMVLFALSTGCASSTMIRSSPSGASVRNQYGRVICITPCEYEDTEAFQHEERFSIEKDGYDTKDIVIRRDKVNGWRTAGFVAGGFLLWPLWIGTPWIFDYDESYKVVLKENPDGVPVQLSAARAE